MIVEPYRRTPAPPTIAVLTPDGVAVGEHGDILSLDDWPAGYVLFASYGTVYRLVREGLGEALCWRGEEIRWRHENTYAQEWVRHASDAAVWKIAWDQLPFDRVLKGFALWRDWLASYGASPSGTSGSAAFSLLRARLERKLITNCGERPPVPFTLGGRQLVGPLGRGSYRGPLTLLDMPSAYARTLAGLRYGGVWLRAADEPGRRMADYVGRDCPIFVRARVRVPAELAYGPLVRRPKRPPRSFMEASLLGAEYPKGKEIQGVWTWEEIAAAEGAGCRVRVLDAWIHRSGWYPFAPWWQAIEEGRSLGGLAGQLAKMTGNALWGRFAMDASLGAVRQIRYMGPKRLVQRTLPTRPAPYPAHDLAETVSGRVRARLWQLVESVPDLVVSAHTDGAWMSYDENGSDGVVDAVLHSGWRVKDAAKRLDLLGPQTLRYWPNRMVPQREPRVVYAGVPAEVAPGVFQEKWEKAGLQARGPVNA